MSQVDDARAWASSSGAHGAPGPGAQVPSPESERGTPPRSGWSGDRHAENVLPAVIACKKFC